MSSDASFGKAIWGGGTQARSDSDSSGHEAAEAVAGNADVSASGGEESGGLNGMERFMRDRVAATLFGRRPGEWKPWSYLVITLTVGRRSAVGQGAVSC